LKPVTVICVLWQGDFRERPYNPDWVRRLKNMVARNLSIPHRFVCLSNVDVPCERIPLKHDWPGWWSCIELFRPDLPVEGLLLHIELDTLIVDSLNEIAEHPADFASASCKDFYPIKFPDPKLRHKIPRAKGRTITKYRNGVMAWDKGARSEIYTKFSPDVMQKFRGDQDWIGHILPNEATFPDQWFIKIRDCSKKQPPPEDVKIVFCNPTKNDQAVNIYPWTAEIWK